MHLERDILKGKFGKNPKLKKEAREELSEKKGSMAKKMRREGHAIKRVVDKYQD
jgi:hypothetical protein